MYNILVLYVKKNTDHSTLPFILNIKSYNWPRQKAYMRKKGGAGPKPKYGRRGEGRWGNVARLRATSEQTLGTKNMLMIESGRKHFLCLSPHHFPSLYASKCHGAWTKKWRGDAKAVSGRPKRFDAVAPGAKQIMRHILPSLCSDDKKNNTSHA